MTNDSVINFISNYNYQKQYELNELITKLNIKNETKEILLSYTYEDYIHSRLQMKYSEILEPVLYFIINNQNKDELLKILDQEIQDSKGKCLQGRISKTINILNGYHDSIKINISNNEQISNIIIKLQKKYLELDKIKRRIRKRIRRERIFERDNRRMVRVYR